MIGKVQKHKGQPWKIKINDCDARYEKLVPGEEIEISVRKVGKQ